MSIVDLVTERKANLCSELLNRLDLRKKQLKVGNDHIYAATIRPRKRTDRPALLDVWYSPLKIGETLPALPIWLSPDLSVDLPLEPGYQETCRLLRIS